MEENKNNKKFENLIYMSDSMRQYMNVLKEFEQVLSDGPMQSPMMEASFMAHMEMIKAQSNYILVHKPQEMTLYFCLEFGEYISRLLQKIYTLSYNVNMWVNGVAKGLNNGIQRRYDFPMMLESYYNEDDETKALFEQMQRCSLPIGKMYLKVLKSISGLLSSYSNVDYTGAMWNSMINDQYKFYWDNIWYEECKDLCFDLEINKEESEHRLKEMQKELFRRLKGHILYRVHLYCCDKNGRNCNHLKFSHELEKTTFNRRWNIGDLNDYFDIVTKIDFVDSIMRGDEVPEYKPYVEDVEEMAEDPFLDEKNQDPREIVLRNFCTILLSLRTVMNLPYDVDSLAHDIKKYVHRDEDFLNEFVSIFQGKSSDRKFGNVSLTVFFAFVKLLMDERIVKSEEPTKIINGVKNYLHLPQEWDFRSVFSKSWDSAKGRQNSRIREMVEEIKRKIG